MALPSDFLRDWGRTCLRLLGAGVATGPPSRFMHRSHDSWMLLLLLKGRVDGQDQFGAWSGAAPASWLLPPGRPVNEDFAGQGQLEVASVLFDALPLPGWRNPLQRLPLPVVVPCRQPERQRRALDALLALCEDWHIADPLGAAQARPDLERLLLDHLTDGAAAGVYEALDVGRIGDRDLDLALATIGNQLRDSDLDVPAMAHIAGMSISGFSQACRRRTGLSPRAWLRRERIRLAVRLLQALPDRSVQEIAWRCGYRSLPLFCRHLVQITGRRARDHRSTDFSGSDDAILLACSRPKRGSGC